MLAELRHRDAAQRERRRILAQAHALEGTERVASDEGARRGRDEGIHRERLTREGAGDAFSERSLRPDCFAGAGRQLRHVTPVVLKDHGRLQVRGDLLEAVERGQRLRAPRVEGGTPLLSQLSWKWAKAPLTGAAPIGFSSRRLWCPGK